MSRSLLTLALLAACGTEEPRGQDRCEQVGVLCVVAGLPGQAGMGADGERASETMLYLPQDVTVSAEGLWWIADYNNHQVREVDPDGVARIVAGSGFPGGGAGGPAREQALDHPTMVLPDPADPDGLWLVDTGNHRIGHLSRQEGGLAFPYGSGVAGFTGDGGPASEASFWRPSSVAFGDAGEMYVSDRMNQVVRRIDRDGTIRTIAGTPGVSGYAGDGGPAADALLNAPPDTEMDPGNRLDVRAGRLVLADSGNGAVRAVDLEEGSIDTILDGLDRPHDVSIGPDGTIYVADTGAACVRAIRPDGGDEVIAGQCGEPGPAEDQVEAADATLDYPCGIFTDEQGSLWIADTDNHVVRRVLQADPP